MDDIEMYRETLIAAARDRLRTATIEDFQRPTGDGYLLLLPITTDELGVRVEMECDSATGCITSAWSVRTDGTIGQPR